jgi:2-dehydro-3-deoxyglucarate aldolase/4-hydroxy-2-oxoheptanedioate aldolase
LKQSLKSGNLVNIFALGHLFDPRLVELIARAGGYDAVWFDIEHVGLTCADIRQGVVAARAAGIGNFVRMPITDYASTMRALEAGAGGIMAAMVRNVQQARDLVRWSRFHPLGERGINGTGPDGGFGTHRWPDYFRHANETTVLGVQVEHIDAVNRVEELAAVEGVDFLFIGPADLSQSLGITGQWDHPEVWKCIERVAAACKAGGPVWGILPLGLPFARRCRDLGCRIFSLGMDAFAFSRGVASFREEYRELFPSSP